MHEELEKIYLVYYSELYKFIIKLGATSDIADDIIQITFLEAWKNIEKYNAKSSLKTWLYAIAKNQLYAYYRKNKIVYSEISEWMEATSIDITDKVLADEITTFIEGLSPPLNEMMKLRLFYGFSFGEIGERIGKTENFCRVNYFRIKERLRKEYYYE